MNEMGTVEIGPGFTIQGANGLGIVEIGPGFEVNGPDGVSLVGAGMGAYDDVSLVGASLGAYDDVSLVGADGVTLVGAFGEGEPWYKKPLNLALIGGGVLVAGVGAYMLMRK